MTLAWWFSRQPRERWVLGGSAVVLILILAYVLVWEPWQQRVQRLHSEVTALQADLVWMQQAAAQLHHAQAAGSVATMRSGGNAMALATQAEQSARSAGLETYLRRIEPQTDGSLRLWLEQVGFSRLLPWLVELRYTHGIRLDEVQLERSTTASGDVINARLTLRGQ